MNTDTATAGQVSKTAAEIYHEFFVPALFGQFAKPLCEAAGIGPGDHVLDVACGTGATTRAAAARIGHDGRIVGLDCNDGMRAVAESRAPDIVWTAGRAEHLPFADGMFDVVLCQFGLMFFDDRAAALREMRRVLRPGGRIAISVWDDVANAPGYAGMIALIDSMFGADAANALRAPFVLGDIRAFGDVLHRGGLDGASLTTLPGTARFATIREWVRMDVFGWTLADFIDQADYEALVQRAETDLRAFAGKDASVAFAAPAHIAVWTKR